MDSIELGELQLIARRALRAHNYDLGDDSRTEIEVAQALGLITLEPVLQIEPGLQEE